MKLDKPMTIVPPSYLLNDQVVHPKAVTVDELNIFYTDSPKNKRIHVMIEHFPIGVQLWGPNEYDAIGDWTQQQAEDRLKSLMNNNMYQFLSTLFRPTGDNNLDGPGSILAGMFSGLGIKTSPTCSCKKHMKEMNLRGNKWCEENIDTILGWLKVESERRKLPFVEMIAKAIVKSAIKKSKRLLDKKRQKQNA